MKNACRRWPLFVVVVLLAGLAVPYDGEARSPQKGTAKNTGKKGGPNVALAQQWLDQANACRQAFGLLAVANHDYGGRRVLAMLEVKKALKKLDAFVLKNGNADQQQATQAGIAAVAAVDVQAKTAGGNENQLLSDKQVRMAGDVLVLVRKSLAAKNQKQVLPHVDAALKFIRVALKIN